MGELRRIEEYKTIELEDIKSLLNPSKSSDLEKILSMVPADVRLDIALIFSKVSRQEIFTHAGLTMNWHNDEALFSRWIKKRVRFPLGAAMRLARVFNVPPELLFEFWSE